MIEINTTKVEKLFRTGQNMGGNKSIARKKSMIESLSEKPNFAKPTGRKEIVTTSLIFAPRFFYCSNYLKSELLTFRNMNCRVF